MTTSNAGHHRPFSYRSIRSVMLSNPVPFLVLSIFVAALIFTVWPEVLSHSPVSFEKRSIFADATIHHIWHYGLLGGSVLALYGMFSANKYRIPLEFVGLIILTVALGMNFTAQLSLFIDEGPQLAATEGVTGLGLCTRAGVIATLALRAWVLIADPLQPVILTVSVDENMPEDKS